MSLAFDRPLLLLLFPVCIGVVYALWRTSRVYMPRLRRRISLALRVMIVGLLVAVLAEPRVHLPANDLAVAFLLDRSDSISPSMQTEEERWLADALSQKAPQDQAAVISFGDQPVVDRAMSTESDPPRLSPPSNFDPSATDIAAAIRAGLAVMPPTIARRLVLISDGQENKEKADTAASLAAAAGVQLMAVPLQSERGPEALVRRLDAPTQLREGERFTASAEVESNFSTTGTLYLLVDGSLRSRQAVTLQPGSSRFLLPVDPLANGHHVLRVQLQVDQDTLAQNKTAGTYVIVEGPPKVLVVEGTPGDGKYLTDALRAMGLQVDLTSPGGGALDGAALLSYASTILIDVPADSLPVGRMNSLKSYVRDHGGGLLVVGGDNAFGPGGYARTPLEDMLPVRMDLRGKSLSTSVALIIVMDISGSMGGGPGGASKMDLAKEAALAAVEQMGDYDQIGILAFDDHNHWMIRPTLANDLTPIEDAIGRMAPQGGTEIYPALKEAYDTIAPLDAKVKHIILLTDGEAPRGPYEDLAAQMEATQVTVSTVGIGSDADTNLLQELAQIMHGRYYDGNDPFDLPQLLVKETQQVQRAAIVEEDFRPLPVSADPATQGIDLQSAPPLKGYVATTPKPQSTVLLASRELDPVLSEWQYGLGRVMAWTSDATNVWASRWLDWPDFGKFWAQLVKRVDRPPADPNRQVTVNIEGNQARITLDAQTGAEETGDRHYLNFLPTQAVLVDPHGAESTVQLPQVAPGRYEARVPVQSDGVYTLTATQIDPTTSESAAVSSGFVVPYSPEYLLTTTDETLLQTIARQTGGRQISDPSDAFAHTLPSVGAPQPLWPLLLLLTAILLVADVGVRRVRISAPEIRSQYISLRRRLGYVDERIGVATRPFIAPKPRGVRAAASVGLAQGPVSFRGGSGGSRSGTGTTQPGRLLAAKRRASRR
ncbi:MAG: VWA domain-containing protein [Chloroflexi bacterium]|nr:VWA domain-containing protein [Chloroflexota bacterium]MBV9596645.1 VWA domain-containing protein [Chloroflexota bacterium]